ncbi:hypothetical protein ACFL2S_02490 [Thermodesulfobacteriota bacterium]
MNDIKHSACDFLRSSRTPGRGPTPATPPGESMQAAITSWWLKYVKTASGRPDRKDVV